MVEEVREVVKVEQDLNVRELITDKSQFHNFYLDNLIKQVISLLSAVDVKGNRKLLKCDNIGRLHVIAQTGGYTGYGKVTKVTTKRTEYVEVELNENTKLVIVDTVTNNGLAQFSLDGTTFGDMYQFYEGTREKLDINIKKMRLYSEADGKTVVWYIYYFY